MAALVAHYLAELAPLEDRKDTIDTSDVTNYSKQAGYPLPQRPKQTLPNARAAGYFDLAGSGKYRLNPVGHNLVVHGLPRAGSSVTRRRPKQPPRASAKAATKKRR